MAQDITLLGASYSDVPAVLLPKTGGGMAAFTDLTGDTVAPGVLLDGYTAHDSSGSPITGTVVDGDLLSYGTDEKIPSTYERVAYVYGRGRSAQLNTGVAGNDNTLEFDLCFEVDKWSSYRGYWGNYTSESANCWRMIATNNDNGTFFCGMNTRASVSTTLNFGSSEAVHDKKIYVTAIYGYIEVTIDGVTKTGTTSTVNTENSTVICIGDNKCNSGHTETTSGTLKWYYAKIRQGNNLIRWYVPCYRKSDNAVGFYDMVNHTFNQSYAQGSFELT